MSGHSKWANIKRKKESTDAKRANIFSKIGKELTVAVRNGGSSDPATNNKLRDVISKAKANNMPNDNITRCIQKAAGDTTGAHYEEVTYEGFGPAGVSVIVEAMTDNRNRAAADIRCIFDRAGGNMGQSGSVSYMFKKKGIIIIEKDNKISEDDLMMEVLENGADDFTVEEEYYEINTNPEDFYSLKEYLENKGYTFMEAEIKMIPDMKKDLTEDEENKLQIFLDKLEENDDVQNIWHNANY
ncbi:MAG: DNA-binding regulatory protein YebC/PmpR family [Clostridia bacterium]|jgi:YebC/PmpR family DNA-binding regulatory protein|nr:DNA-binding regulatory protein YebC/PmpR family [Clostridia bacterium]